MSDPSKRSKTGRVPPRREALSPPIILLTVIEVAHTPEGVAFTIDGAAKGPRPWVDGWSFRHDAARLTFRRSGSSGPATELRYDTGGDHFILKRQ